MCCVHFGRVWAAYVRTRCYEIAAYWILMAESFFQVVSGKWSLFCLFCVYPLPTLVCHTVAFEPILSTVVAFVCVGCGNAVDQTGVKEFRLQYITGLCHICCLHFWNLRLHWIFYSAGILGWIAYSYVKLHSSTATVIQNTST